MVSKRVRFMAIGRGRQCYPGCHAAGKWSKPRMRRPEGASKDAICPHRKVLEEIIIKQKGKNLHCLPAPSAGSTNPWEVLPHTRLTWV